LISKGFLSLYCALPFLVLVAEIIDKLLSFTIIGYLQSSELFAALLGAFIYHFGKFRLFQTPKNEKMGMDYIPHSL